MAFNTTSLDTVCCALCYALGINPPAQAAEKNADFAKYIDEKFAGAKADRIFMYNPDAIAQWIYEKYPQLFVIGERHAELIMKDEHDFYVVYNGNYDSVMHKNGPESIAALSQIQANCRTFGMFSEMIKNHWSGHNTLEGFAMDHGCHEIDGDCGSHGLDMPEDLNITHLYKAYAK